MKKITLLLLSIAFIANSCSNDNEPNTVAEEDNEPIEYDLSGEFLVSKINFGNTEPPLFQHNIEYNSDNQPIAIYTSGPDLPEELSFQFEYDSDKNLKSILQYTPMYETTCFGNGYLYTKHEVKNREVSPDGIERTEFSSKGFSEDGEVVCTVPYTWVVTKKDGLITSFYETATDVGVWDIYFNHDTDGNLVSIAQFESNQIMLEATSWDEGTRPITMSTVVDHVLPGGFPELWFVNDRISNNNPTTIRVRESASSESMFDLVPTLTYDEFGNVISEVYTSENGIESTFERTYIPVE
ncbi:hypothetical protein [Altibacter sp. HG106]|uniref:hypothetical protein n=1 Tax=Altibacter sp. HG106 TaxID=3023937 RepID=UPI002350506D|nr:hypothetical protein [Altibacter sp. HG106]MDC7996083.1 hypothetical protein [Altibacter sp. HG106]